MNPPTSFDPAAVVEWALESLRTSPSTGVVLGEEHLLLVANQRALDLLGLAEIPAAGVDWIGMTPPEYRTGDDEAMTDAKLYGASSWFQKEYIICDGERRRVELLVIALQNEPFRWLALLRSAGSSPLRPGPPLRAGQPGRSLLRLARRLAGAASLEEVMRIVDRLGAGALDADSVSVCLLNEDGTQLTVHHDPTTSPGVASRYAEIAVAETTMIGAAAHRDAAELLEIGRYESRYPGYGADARAMGLGHLAAVPMHDPNGDLVGVLGIGWKSLGEVDLGLIESIADLIGDAVRLARDSDRNRATAGAFQEMLLPTRLDSADPALVGARYHSVDESVGGDFYDVVTRGEATTWFVIGDVVGHGISASRTMGKIRFFLRALLYDATDPAAVLEALNRLVLAEQQHEVATCLVAVWDRVEHTLSLASAGHLPQLAIIDGEARLLAPVPDPPLGVERSGPGHGATTIDISHGATLVFYTDGLVERRDVPIDESLRWLSERVGSWPSLGLDELLDRLFEIAAGGVDDDVAILGVEIPRATVA